ncbi:signal peptidase II [Pseudodesulfovibrio piezophilus]|uniref:Lipoprotein signal peptidase n=1 Tax=Pseudodesulfovibrio piezophilus (strain DSM 21447 / JCM 15486 / C1TLV30) TaxID=1322246 RepID=M1WLC6_PSEP2|nr:signal peptidase II [Pseudodesulfovibrio piezophilus]CCH47630.1 Lipoprotein signal peptidase [Pseudodesulfovibrio piezophilus C1TLV30]
MHRYKLASFWAIAVIILDQATKLWISSAMEVWTGKTIIPEFFNLVHVLNRGAAWGFLDSDTISWQRPLFIVVTFIALGFIGFMLKTTEPSDKWMVSGLGLITGGAVGNLIDRIHLGVVVDFLDFYLGTHHWPAFNIADCALTLGAGCILLSMFYNKRKGTSQ